MVLFFPGMQAFSRCRGERRVAGGGMVRGDFSGVLPLDSLMGESFLISYACLMFWTLSVLFTILLTEKRGKNQHGPFPSQRRYEKED